MALQYVGGTTDAWFSVTTSRTISLGSLTGGMASSPSAGDIVIVAFMQGSAADRTASMAIGSGDYTILRSIYSGASSSYDTNLVISYKVLTLADLSVAIGPSAIAGTASSVAIHVWRGADSSTPFDVPSVPASFTTSSLATATNPSAITPITPGAVVLAVGAGAGYSTIIYSATALSNFISAVYTSTATDAAIGIGSSDWTSGSFDPVPWSGGSSGNSSASWVAVTLALRPSAPAAPLTLEPPLVTNAQTFFDPTVSPGAVGLSSPLLTSTQSFFALAVNPGAASLAPALLTSSQVFYAPLIGGNLLVTGSATGQCSVAGNLKLSSGLASASAISGFATANLQIKSGLVGSSAGYVTASGYLAYSYLLAGSVTGSISASGSLSTAAQSTFSAIALVTAAAQANMSLHKDIAGNVSSSLSAIPTTLLVGTLKQLIGNTSLSAQALGLLAKTNNQATDVLVSVNAYGALNQGISLNGAVSFSSNTYSTVYVNKYLDSNQVILFNCSGRLVKLTQTSFDTIIVAVKPDYIWASIDVNTIKAFAVV